jgi:UDP-glucose 4-epimerase
VTELHQLVAEAVGVPSTPEFAAARGGELHASALDPTLAGQVLGWKPDTDLVEGVKRTVEWLSRLRPSAIPA